MSRELERLRKQHQESTREAAKNLENAKSLLSANWESTSFHLGQIAGRQHRVTEISCAPMVVINEIESDFKKVTRLSDVDIPFLFLATALQCARQYLLTPATIRKGDQEAAHEVKETQEHSNRSHRLYNPSLQEIITNPVPFDANVGSSKYQALSGFGYLGHRGATIGHDPIMGLVFGTANIATSTLTNWNMDSYHIKTATVGQGNRDFFASRANTAKVLSATFSEKLLHQGIEGKTIVGVSVEKEIQHLRSDVYSKNSLPLPLISVIDPSLAGDLARRGVDMASILDCGKQFAYAMAIDVLIAITHSLFFDPAIHISRTAYEVKTRRVLTYSNLLATTSNIIASLVAEVRFVDWGGYINTLRRIAFDTIFIQKVKEDFLKNELYSRIVGPEYDFMEGK